MDSGSREGREEGKEKRLLGGCKVWKLVWTVGTVTCVHVCPIYIVYSVKSV